LGLGQLGQLFGLEGLLVVDALLEVTNFSRAPGALQLKVVEDLEAQLFVQEVGNLQVEGIYNRRELGWHPLQHPRRGL